MGLCELRWNNFGEISTDDEHKVYFSGEEDRHEYGFGFLVHEDIAIAVLGCRPVSSRLISICLGAYRFMHQHLVMMTVRLTTSTSNYRKS